MSMFYMCFECGKTFPWGWGLKEHLRKKHNIVKSNLYPNS
jgi:DNA-directed RNA polymerase subunit RPC12/RpoP